MRLDRLTGLAITFTLLILFISGYYIVKYPVESVFGERYVRDQIPLLFPFFVIQSFKPVTLLVIFGFALWVTLLERSRIWLKLSGSLARIVMGVGAFTACYELIWNYIAWFTLWSVKRGSLDALANTTHEHAGIPVSFNFATKIYFLVTAVFLYGMWRTSQRQQIAS
ncbi:MAG: hypothetical protein V1857_00460 [archaeon]